MSTQTQTIRVRIFPGVRMWQALLVSAAIVASLLLGLAIGRASAPTAAPPIGSRDFSAYACTGHVPNPPCRPAEVGYVNTGHVPPGGYGHANG